MTATIICPWHYKKANSYPSLKLFIEKGFRVLPASWRDVNAARALMEYSLDLRSSQMLGHLFTTWSKRDLLNYPPVVKCLEMLINREQ